MANLTETEQSIVASEPQASDPPGIQSAGSFPRTADSGSSWNTSTLSALLLLVVLWAVKLYTTWGAWGNLTVDSGHAMTDKAIREIERKPVDFLLWSNRTFRNKELRNLERILTPNLAIT